MTISALLLGRQFYDLEPSPRLKYATLGVLFVNISIGGTLTQFAAPPVLMVARPWGWDIPFMLVNFGWRAITAILISTAAYFVLFRAEFRSLSARAPVPDVEQLENGSSGKLLFPVPGWVVAVHLGFMAWTVFNSHYPALFLGGFLFFLGFARATAPYQSRIELKTPLLVGFFLAGLVIHGGLQGWWIGPVLGRLPEGPLFVGAAALTAINDNALITYLATLVPNLGRRVETCRRAGGRGRRRIDGDRQRAESSRPGIARTLLRRRHFSARTPRRSDRTDAHRPHRLSHAVRSRPPYRDCAHPDARQRLIGVSSAFRSPSTYCMPARRCSSIGRMA